MPDRGIWHREAQGVLERRQALRPFAVTDFSEGGEDPSMELVLTPWTTNEPPTQPWGTSLAQPSDLHAAGAYTAIILRVTGVGLGISRFALTPLALTAPFGVRALTDPVALDRYSSPIRVVLRGDNCFVLKASDETPFTEIDLVEGEDESIDAMILAAPSSVPVPYSAQLGRRLMELLAASREEAGVEPGMSRSSLKWFLDFMRSNTQLACPMLALTPDGNIYATWKRSSDALFSAHFIPSGLVRFVVFAPNPRSRGAVTRLSGATTVSNLIDTVRPHGVLSWACREG